MANVMKTLVTINGSKEDIEKIANRILVNDEWKEYLDKRNEGLGEGFKITPNKSYEDKEEIIDFNRLVETPKTIFQGNLGDKEEKKYGADNCWYEWNCKHWGTKWNAYDTYAKKTDDALYLEFSTAWSVPITYLEELGKIVAENNCTIDGCYSDEYYENEYMGHFGMTENKKLFITNETSPDIFEEVWGYNPVEDEEWDYVSDCEKESESKENNEE